MRKWLPTFATLLVLTALPPPAVRAADPPKEESKPKKPDVAADINKPRADARKIQFQTSEGTWMSVDVSPDGKTLVFDLLGDLYTLPIAGGDAKSLTHGVSWDMQPRFSPDGKHIAFTSDRDGGDNIWIVPSSGGEPTQVTDEDFRLLN